MHPLKFFILWLCFYPHPSHAKNFFIVWNVGQGQWASATSIHQCLHFDLGGEYFPLERANMLCASKNNKIFLSHWDLDHVSGVKRFSQNVSKVCLFEAPPGKVSPTKLKLISNIERCPSLTESFEKKVNLIYKPQLNSINKGTNDLSRVILFDDHFLIPGDSTNRQEKIWATHPLLNKARVLLLGHHGSHTSSSVQLLSHLPRLKMAIASARRQKYGHPHPQIVRRIRARRIPLLRTEDWGNIWIEF